MKSTDSGMAVPPRELLRGNNVQRIKGIDKAFFIPHSDAVLADKEKFGMRNDKLLTFGRANGERTKAAAQPFL